MLKISRIGKDIYGLIESLPEIKGTRLDTKFFLNHLRMVKYVVHHNVEHRTVGIHDL
jgi:hypothetical protein